jgi:predicted SAM-dependent methyltransferase
MEGSLAHRLHIGDLRFSETKREIGAQLQRWPIAWTAGALVLRAINQPRRAAQVREYLATNSVRKLRIGAGPHADEGWLSADRVPLSKNIVYMDATKVLPLPDASFDVIVCEHLIEHLELRHGRAMLAQFRRVLRPGGVLRIATPDLRMVVGAALPDTEVDPEFREYVTIVNSANSEVPAGDRDNPVYTINRVVRAWGHQFIYDEPTLRFLLVEAGFDAIERCSVGQSTHPDLVGVERHQEEIGERHNVLETMILEAISPAV